MNHIISVGSVDGILTTSAISMILEQWGEKNISWQWCQAFTVDKVVLPDIPSNIWMVDLAVNNRDPEMTKGLIKRIDENGHTLMGIADEHNSQDWKDVLGEERFNNLKIQPKDRNKDNVLCSGDCLRELLTHFNFDEKLPISELISEARAADCGNFGKIHIGSQNPGSIEIPARWLANAVIKPAIKDDSRRDLLVKYFSMEDTSVKTLFILMKWASEYEEMQEAMEEIFQYREENGGIWTIDTRGYGSVDITSLCMICYDAGAKVLVTRCLQRTRNDPVVKDRSVISSRDMDLLTSIKKATPEAMGMSNRVTVNLEDEEKALEAIKGDYNL